MKHFYVLLAALTINCTSPASAPLGPSGPSATSAAPLWILAGQSNAVRMAPFLEPALIPLHVPLRVSGLGGMPLSYWNADQPGWADLRPTLTPDVTAIIWWQGEQNLYDAPGVYEAALHVFFNRVRAVVGHRFAIVICGVTARDIFDTVRADQQRFAASDPDAVYVPSIGLPVQGDSIAGYDTTHLNADGYVQMVDRILHTLKH